MKTVIVSGTFDDLRSRHVRFLEEAARLGAVHVVLWSDDVVELQQGKRPAFPELERHYLLQSIRYVSGVTLVGSLPDPDALPIVEGLRPDAWVVEEAAASAAKQAYCRARGLEYRVLHDDDYGGFPPQQVRLDRPGKRKKAIVTGCYDWLHSGHVRFFEEVSSLGDVYVGVGSDATVEQLKGPGHPMLAQDERCYMVQSIRYVTQAFVSSGHGWMDAEPELAIIRPDLYVVNEDGDRPEKRAYCAAHGLQYVVLRRLPKEGLPRRQSTELRGF